MLNHNHSFDTLHSSLSPYITSNRLNPYSIAYIFVKKSFISLCNQVINTVLCLIKKQKEKRKNNYKTHKITFILFVFISLHTYKYKNRRVKRITARVKVYY